MATGAEAGVGFGWIHTYDDDFDPSTHITDTYTTDLIGAVKGNHRYGNITPDWMFHVGVQEISEYVINVYPNPAHDQLLIEGITGPSTAILYNSLGVAVKELKTNENRSIDLSSLNDGTYFLKVATGDKAPIIKRIVKN